MSNDITNLRSTIIPKSDQLNADQLVGGEMVITVTDINLSGNSDQPLIIHYEGENGRPFKPAKTVRKILVFAWGEDGNQWIGRKMRLYHDPKVTWAGAEVGGIRVKQLSHIERPISVTLAKSKTVKEVHRVDLLVDDEGPTIDEVVAAIDAANNRATMAQAKEMIGQLSTKIDQDVAIKAYNQRAAALRAAAEAAKAAPAEPAE